jgi:hypothetical protein
VLSGLAVSPRSFALSGRLVSGRCVPATHANRAHRGCTRPIALRVTFKLSSPASVLLSVQKLVPGRQVNGRCVAATSANRNQRRCTRRLQLNGKIVTNKPAGQNSLTFNGRIGGHRLAPGSYLLTATPTGGQPGTVTFAIRP